MSLNDSLTDVERAKLAVWDYPVSDRYTKMWNAMQEAGLPNSLENAVARVLDSPSSSEGFAYLGRSGENLLNRRGLLTGLGRKFNAGFDTMTRFGCGVFCLIVFVYVCVWKRLEYLAGCRKLNFTGFAYIYVKDVLL